jgi:ABC-2 type transport system ATP-binding protein
MIEVQGVSKYYGTIPALRDVTFQVGQGEVIGFLGPNGAGKSTTMRILTGFTPASRGTARVAGFEVHQSPLEVKRRVGYLPERVPLYDEMVVGAFLRYVAEIKGIARAARTTEVGRAMERCGLLGMEKRTLRNLSKGYRQRVGLAQALLGSPPVLILDEPTVGLDPRQIIEIRKMIAELGQDHTVLLSTHILPEVAMVCQRVLILNEGRIVAENRMDQFQGGDAEARARELESAFMAAITRDRALEEGAA